MLLICGIYRWSKIAQHLPGRTDNEIKNYWRTRVQKQARQLNIESGSKRFIDAVKCFWMPRLLQKMEQNSSPTSQTNMNFGNSTEASSSSISSISNSFNVPSISMTQSIDAANHLSTMSSSSNLSSDFFQFSQPLENLENSKSATNVFENNDYSSYPNQESYYIDDTNHYGLQGLNLDPLFSLENYDISQFDYQTEGNGWMLDNMSDTLWNNMDAM